MGKDIEELVILENRDWNLIKGKWLRVLEFNPLGKIENGQIIALDFFTPYASIRTESSKSPHIIHIYITHEIDFRHLWRVFKERPLGENEEVLVFCPKKYAKKIPKFLSSGLPRMHVSIWSKGTFDLMTNPKYRPELEGEARRKARRLIKIYIPDVF
jgi:hypothetical protein